MSSFDEAMFMLSTNKLTEDEYVYMIHIMSKEGFANRKIVVKDNNYYKYSIGARVKDKHSHFINDGFAPFMHSDM